jgi:23S rRNA (cytosine1962-C5)-methyltransferase
MFPPDQYELLDFGGARRLERVGGAVLDRPCPTAERIAPGDPPRWQAADARFQRTGELEGDWSFTRPLPQPWTVAHEPLVLELRPTPFGHVGLFPEQADNWEWIRVQVARALESGVRPRVLNLFAYTGASTLAAAAAGAEVVHVDAARNIVAWARRNGELSGLAERPIRWVVEDAVKFVKRELARGNRYDAVILDPPSYGHGPRGEVWRLSKYLGRLLAMCGELTAGSRQFMLMTCHTPGFDGARLARMLATALGNNAGSVTAEPMTLAAADGRRLPSGVALRWSPEPGRGN